MAIIKEIFITPPFDESVGIREATYTITDLYYDTDDYEAGELEEFRKALGDAFSLVDDSPVTVVFDVEIPEAPDGEGVDEV